MLLQSIKFTIALFLCLTFLSCAKEVPELELNNFFDEESGIEVELYRLENFTYNDFGFPYYEVYFDVVVDWNKLSAYENITRCRFNVEGLGFSVHNKGESPLRIRRLLDKGKNYCTSISFIESDDLESRKLFGECFDVPE